ncbi:MAG: hypothetical protein KBC12_00305 [Candidatus Pacebacteria bacterium]|nr:hypothetical protein [Candidatus Paceibacterota bacterium]MBP9851094.1 hypothetical protein [Candidatus Paceibacterota bacterium]
MTDEKAKRIEEIYNKAITRLKELFNLEKQIIAKHKKNIEDKKIEELRNKIQNNG